MIRVILRLSLVFFALICLIGGTSFIIFNVYLINNINEVSFEIKNSITITNIVVIIVSFIGLFLSITSILLIEIRGIKAYDKILDNIDLASKSINNLTNINFPKKDELGNLGAKIFSIISVMASFDLIKKGIIQKQISQIDYIIKNYHDAIVMLDHTYTITKVNTNFENTFNISKSVNKSIFELIEFINYNLKAMADSYEKQSVECNIRLADKIYKSFINFKRFINENGVQEYILIFSDVVITHSNLEKEDA